MNLQAQVIKLLETYQKARERRFKDDALVYLLKQKYKALEGVPSKLLVEFAQDYDSANRYWRQALERDEKLRGTDYEDKARYSQAKQFELGYESGYHEQVKKGAML